MPGPEATRPDDLSPLTGSARTLSDAADLVAALTEDGHLRPPGTIVVSDGHVTIMPESTSSTPITSLLAWTDHMEDNPTFEAAAIGGVSFRSLHITASGTIDGLSVAISASTVRVPDTVARKVDPAAVGVSLSKLDVIELACSEDVLGV